MTDPNPRLAAIDVGTNSFRLVVAEVEPDGTYRVLDEEQEMTRLGRGLFKTGRLAHVPMERSLETLGKMKAIAEGFQVAELRAVATSAVREASNGRAFLREVWKRHRLKVEVISGDEEAQLAFQSVNRHFNLEGRSVAIVDIGGGSVEVILVADGVIDQVHSLPLGAVRLTEKYVKSDPLRRKHWKALRRHIDSVIQRVVGEPPFTAEVMIGSGGTFSNLGQMMRYAREGQAGPLTGYALSRAEVIRLRDRLRETPLGARRQIPGVNPKRADILLAGVAVVTRLCRHLGTQRVEVNDRGIRDGVLLAMIADRLGPEAAAKPEPLDRLERVRQFAEKCRSNVRHCGHVARMAGEIFDGLKGAFELPEQGRDILTAGALLHDIGYLINHAKHHKHAYHLIMHGDLPGFSAREVELIANVARYHRRAMPRKSHENFARLDPADRRLVRQLAGILRVADGLDRTHTQAVSGLRVVVEDDHIEVRIRAPRYPRVDVEDAVRKSRLLRKAFDAKVAIEWVKERVPAASPGAAAKPGSGGET
jgi:exopolyphosphatase/guanosine-5'-triphosphate,3'-diphosphate pyrophosphatase